MGPRYFCNENVGRVLETFVGSSKICQNVNENLVPRHLKTQHIIMNTLVYSHYHPAAMYGFGTYLVFSCLGFFFGVVNLKNVCIYVEVFST